MRVPTFCRVGLAVSVLLAAIPSFATAVTFTDDTFNNGNWTATMFFNVNPASFDAHQVDPGGNPGAYRDLTMTYQGPDGSIAVSHVRAGDVYDPSTQGAIAKIDYAYDVNFFDFPGTGTGDPSRAVGYDALVLQGLTVFVHSLTVGDTDDWDHFDQPDLTAADFTEFNGSSHPNFSAAGGPIQLGYVTRNGTCCGETSTHSGIDNWSVTVTPAAVPEPGTLVLVSSGLVALGGGVWGRRQRLR